jgi:hypothetical protein
MKALAANILIIIVIFYYASGSAGSKADEYIQYTPFGKINWTQGFIEAVGYEGPPPHYKDRRLSAIEVARQQAQQNIYDVLKTVQIDSSLTVQNVIQMDEQVDKRLKAIISNSDVVDKNTSHDGSVQVILQLKMHGALAQLLLPSHIKQIERLKSVQKSNPGVHQTKNSQYTGLLIDATGLNIQPAMAPLIFNESGQEIYGGAFASREFAVQRGMIIYAQQIESAFVSNRIKSNPIIIKALKAKSPANCNLVISDGDASVILGASEHIAFLKQCLVVVLIDGPKIPNP